ncbi:MAG: HNH endonuclease signature motif containing protein [Bacteroidota bacterium]
MANKKPIPKPTEKLIYQQAGSRCSFCSFDEIDALDIHHIVPRSEDGSNEPGNLVLACKNCHARIHSKAIPEAEVRRVKASQGAVIHQMPGRSTSRPLGNIVSIGRDATGSIVAGGDIHVHGDVKPNGRMHYPAGSIGTDLHRKNYVGYLITRYNEFRSTGLQSYGQKGRHNHGVISSNIKSKFKVAGVYHVPIERFDELIRYLHGRIDRTIQGKTNKARGHRAYSSFEDFAREQGEG